MLHCCSATSAVSTRVPVQEPVPGYDAQLPFVGKPITIGMRCHLQTCRWREGDDEIKAEDLQIFSRTHSGHRPSVTTLKAEQFIDSKQHCSFSVSPLVQLFTTVTTSMEF
ncbi:hypothetical protein MHYP_G00017460 [Metynnis hypsauchen]